MNTFRKAFYIFFLVGFENSEAVDYVCTPAVDCQTYGVGALVPDPIDCQKYYVCVTSSNGPIPAVTSSTCPDGQFFDGSAGGCKNDLSPGICNSACGDNVCSLSCPANFTELTFIPSSFDCSVYYLCTESGAIPISCPSDTPYFNGIGCVADATQCCSCRPHCLIAGTEIQDPCDCVSYYICSSVGQPHSINGGSCNPGFYFNEGQSACVAGFCQNKCSTCATN